MKKQTLSACASEAGIAGSRGGKGRGPKPRGCPDERSITTSLVEISRGGDHRLAVHSRPPRSAGQRNGGSTREPIFPNGSHLLFLRELAFKGPHVYSTRAGGLRMFDPPVARKLPIWSYHKRGSVAKIAVVGRLGPE